MREDLSLGSLSIFRNVFGRDSSSPVSSLKSSSLLFSAGTIFILISDSELDMGDPGLVSRLNRCPLTRFHTSISPQKSEVTRRKEFEVLEPQLVARARMSSLWPLNSSWRQWGKGYCTSWTESPTVSPLLRASSEKTLMWRSQPTEIIKLEMSKEKKSGFAFVRRKLPLHASCMTETMSSINVNCSDRKCCYELEHT